MYMCVYVCLHFMYMFYLFSTHEKENKKTQMIIYNLLIRIFLLCRRFFYGTRNTIKKKTLSFAYLIIYRKCKGFSLKYLMFRFLSFHISLPPIWRTTLCMLIQRKETYFFCLLLVCFCLKFFVLFNP